MGGALVRADGRGGRGKVKAVVFPTPLRPALPSRVPSAPAPLTAGSCARGLEQKFQEDAPTVGGELSTRHRLRRIPDNCLVDDPFFCDFPSELPICPLWVQWCTAGSARSYEVEQVRVEEGPRSFHQNLTTRANRREFYYL